MAHLYLPDLLFADGSAHEGVGLLVNDGRVAGIVTPRAAAQAEVVRLPGRALLPGLANAHSHSFQRLFRGRAEDRREGGDTFWTWREQMYRAAAFVSSENLYDVARATFLEMALSGITAVGEFHYLHNQPDGTAYGNPNLLAETILQAAASIGIRINLLRTAYLRAGFQRDPHPGQQRFYEKPDAYLRNLEALEKTVHGNPLFSVGAAPHSIRAVPLEVMREIAACARQRAMVLHLHISEQTGENEACVAEYGKTPVELVAENGILTERTTLVHAIHLSEREFAAVGRAESTIASCPTTERNLGDGIFPAALAFEKQIHVAFGTDSQAQIDLLEDGRQLEYHLRLQQRERGILDGIGGEAIGARLLGCATRNGYRALGLEGGSLSAGEPADFFTLDLNDLSLLGADRGSLAMQAVFAANKSAVREVAVAGKLLVQNGRHAREEEIRSRYAAVQKAFAQK
jgi:formimidoylglutamate deiminase